MRPDFKKMNNMIPAVVQDYKTNEVLMLAYVNEEAYDKMLETKETYFYSRSRNELWHKGETSGHYQYVKGMYLDCDNDTLLILVEQIGNACHTGAYSCFFNEIIEDERTADIFEEVYKRVQDRQVHPVDNSYTNYLYDQGVDKICKKIGEEASEVIIGAKNDNNEELIGEISDLIYHLFVLMCNQGVTLDDIKAKLAQRHKIEGNKKVFHTRGDY